MATTRRTCGALTKDGRPCGQVPLQGQTRCRLHGGASSRGLAHPSLKSGRYSKVLPSRLIRSYEDSLRDGSLIALRDEIALMDAHMTELLSGDVGNGASWSALEQARDELTNARARKDKAGETAAIDKLMRLIESGNADSARWHDIMEAIDLRRRLVDTERRRLTDAQQMMTAEQVMTLVTALADAVRTHVTDPNVLALVTRELARLVGKGATGSAFSADAEG